MKTYKSKCDKFICVLLFFVIIISSLGIGCKKEITIPSSPISAYELESLMESFNNNDVSWDSFRTIISDSLNYKVVYDWASSHVGNNTTAQFLLGRCYERGEGVEKNLSKAVELYTKAADQGYAPAQCYLGRRYVMGEGVEKNLSKAVELFTKAADQGNAWAQCKLGRCYERGEGVEKNLPKAVELYNKHDEN